MGHENQHWETRFVKGSKNEYNIVCADSRKVLDEDLQLREYDANRKSQRWYFHGQDPIWRIFNCASGKMLELAVEDIEKDGGKIQLCDKDDDQDPDNQRWKFEKTKDRRLGKIVETVSPSGAAAMGGEMQVVWVDPERAETSRKLQHADIVRFEFPQSGGEIPWSNELGRGGLDAFAVPRLDLVYRVYRKEGPNSVPRIVSEIPMLEKGAVGFWRARDKSMMSVPLFFAGVLPREGKKIDYDPSHKQMSVAFLASPYDWGVVLASAEALMFVRARLAWQKDWVAVDLHLYNIYGPSIDVPPAISVRVDGGEQLDDLPIDLADKLIPTGLVSGEYTSPNTHTVGVNPMVNVQVGPIGLGVGVAYSFSYSTEPGKFTSRTEVHPMRRELYTKAWQASRLEEGSFRRGLVLFKLPKAKPVHQHSGATLIIKTPTPGGIVHLDFKGRPPQSVKIPGSALGEISYSYSTNP